MPLPITIPNTFANATATIPLSQLDNNFSTVAVAVNSIGNGAFTLANAQITGGTISNVTLDNVSVDVETLSNVTITNLTVNGNATLTNAAVTANVATITTANTTDVTASNSAVIAVNTSGNALRITQTGTGNALVVEDSANPDSTPFVVKADGGVIVGYTTSVTGTGPATATSPPLQVHGITNNTSSLGLYNWSSTGSFVDTLSFNRSLSNTIGTFGGAVTSGVDLGAVSFSGDDGTSFIEGARIFAEVDGTPGTNDMPGRLVFSTTADGASTPTERMRIDSSGNVGIGTSSPSYPLHVQFSSAVAYSSSDMSAAGITAFLYNSSVTDSTATTLYMGVNGTSTDAAAAISTVYTSASNGALAFGTRGGGNVIERARIDSSGRLLVGLTSTNTAFGGKLQVEGTSDAVASLVRYSSSAGGAPQIYLARSKSATLGTNTIVASADTLGTLVFSGANGTGYSDAAYIQGFVDGTPGASADMPGRLVFSTSADGSATPTERMRIDSSGNLLVGKTAADNSTQGFRVEGSIGFASCVRSSGPGLMVNRLTDDGELVLFFQANTQEGTISVSGTTVSYNGGHLSRWAQMLTKPDLLKGTVMSNLDEMNEYFDADGNPVPNEQLNKVKVSDVEGDANVAGVFVNWTHDEAHDVDEINMAMTGDMIIRIAQGVTVARGDLLMSAGDGTAKPQGDDIVRSKTIAKVTSNHVTCTYDDGSYCVPCVLMAC
jgi:hypothetical protein